MPPTSPPAPWARGLIVTTLTALACLTALLAVVPPPATAGPAARKVTVGRAGAMWQSSQLIQTTTITVGMQWARVKGATTYEIDYTPARRALRGAEIQSSTRKRTIKVRGTRASVQGVRISGLAPSTIYCFQVRGRNGKRVGYRGPAHCKVTARLDRALRGQSVPMVVGTFNVCSSLCSTLLPWSTRRSLVLRRIREMNVGNGGRAVDVLAVQEASLATPWLREEALAGTFTQACQTIEGTTHDNQSVFVRNSTYTVVPGSQGGLRFDAARFNDPSHGACWAKVRERVSGLEVVVVGLHLQTHSTRTDDLTRAAEAAELVQRVKAAHPGVPMVFAGDTNSTRSHALDGPLIEFQKGGLRDAYEQTARYRSRPYRNSACGSTGAVRKSIAWGDHVDRVFAPPGVHVTSWEVDYRLKSASRYVTPLAADHNPVLVSLLFPAPAAPTP